MLATRMSDPSPLPVVGIDLGGTSIKVALVAPGLELLDRGQVPTDLRSQTDVAGRDRAAGRIGAWRPAGGRRRFRPPVEIDQRHGRVLDSINVPLEDLDFVAEMRRRLETRVVIDNDANVACLAEARIGAAPAWTTL